MTSLKPYSDRTESTAASSATKPGYIILDEKSAETLAAAVNLAVADGYQPLGGVSVAMAFVSYENTRKGYKEEDLEVIYAQAMGR